MGLQFNGLEDAPFKNIGVTLAIFHSDGTSPYCINSRHKIARGSDKTCTSCLNNKGGKPSGPAEDLQLSLEIHLCTIIESKYIV